MKVRFSGHARAQAELRFPTIDIENELDNLVELGGQAGDYKAYLTKSDIVLIVSKDQTVVTVMPKSMYMANMAAKCRIDHAALLKPITVDEVKRKEHKMEVARERARLAREKESIRQQDICNKLVAQREKAQREKEERARLVEKWMAEVKQIAIMDVEHDFNNNLSMMDTLKDRRQKIKDLGYNSKMRSRYEALYVEYYISTERNARSIIE